MEYYNYSRPLPAPYPPEFNGIAPHFVARAMIAFPGTTFETAVERFDELAEQLRQEGFDRSVDDEPRSAAGRSARLVDALGWRL